MARPTPLMGLPDGIAQLNPDELTVWNAYQDFLHCIEYQSVSAEGMVVTAAILASTYITNYKVKP